MQYKRGYNYGNDRQFVFPFLVGALTGGAAIGLTRPRPIFNVNPYPYYPNYPMGPYGNYSYSYYYPYRWSLGFFFLEKIIDKNKKLVIIDDPPYDKNGKGIPMIGNRPIFILIFIKILNDNAEKKA